MSGLLVLEDGAVWRGRSVGKAGVALGEVVFSTSMTGYQEMLSDPSYGGQILTFTYPLIGNYGVADQNFESRRVQVEGAVMRELCEAPNHWRSSGSLGAFLAEHEVVALADVDTRSLTRHLRTQGVLRGGIAGEGGAAELLERVRTGPDYGRIDHVRRVSTRQPYVWKDAALPQEGAPATGRRVALLDLGVKFNILRRLSALGCEVHVFPCDAPPEALLEIDPHGIVASPGPGDPALLGYADATVRAVVGKKPFLGICLGHQLLGAAFGARTFKLKFGHRGGNHPVKELATGHVTITSQNHGYAVDAAGLDAAGLEVSRVNLNDGTVEGLRHRELPVFSVQYHPEASPGPLDSDGLFGQFIQSMGHANK